MTITTQWLIFGCAMAGLFIWGLLARDRESDAKEGHTAPQIKTRIQNRTQPESALHETAHV